jgi:hypothetical protein
MRVVINGKYMEADSLTPSDSSSQYKAWNMEDQRRLHSKDILQAHKRGKPNPEFIREYPDEAKRFFTQDQINQGLNTYE